MTSKASPRSCSTSTVPTVFSEPQVDNVAYTTVPDFAGAKVFATEFLPGQFDQRADSRRRVHPAHQPGRAPDRAAPPSVYAAGRRPDRRRRWTDHQALRDQPGRGPRGVSLETKETLKTQVRRCPAKVETHRRFQRDGRRSRPEKFIDELRSGHGSRPTSNSARSTSARSSREPTITEIKVIDTYWSDHCRHTTFGTDAGRSDRSMTPPSRPPSSVTWRCASELRAVTTKPVCLMDMGTIGAKWLKKNGVLTEP